MQAYVKKELTTNSCANSIITAEIWKPTWSTKIPVPALEMNRPAPLKDVHKPATSPWVDGESGKPKKKKKKIALKFTFSNVKTTDVVQITYLSIFLSYSIVVFYPIFIAIVEEE